MNFYKAQSLAKQKTLYLVLFFIFILFLIIVFSSIVLIVIFSLSNAESSFSNIFSSLFSDENKAVFYAVSAFIVGGAILSSFSKNKQLSKGGGVIAASMGGVKLASNTESLNQRKLLNVVEEMAIASGMPVPEVFVLKSEKGINAFAAGNNPSDAAIGVTQGCIDKLTRPQLQGVIGHEFSHILNGDMRLNTRIIMIIHGVGFVGNLGYILMKTSRHWNRNVVMGVVLAGFVLLVLGWIGNLAGKIIQAAVSRQREFLADASSVQFTRDPSAIADALKVIGWGKTSSRIKNKEAKEIAHMFFGEGFKSLFGSLFNTHPPIEDRILAIEPEWEGDFLEPVLNKELLFSAKSSTIKQATMLFPMGLQILSRAGVNVNKLSESNQGKLNQLILNTRDPFDAMTLVVAILIYKEKVSIDLLANWSLNFQKIKVESLRERVGQQITLLSSVGLINFLPLVELAIPSLKNLSINQYLPFKSLLKTIIEDDDEKETVFEKSIYQLVIHYLDSHFGILKPSAVRYYSTSQVSAELQVVLSVVIHFGEEGHDSALEQKEKQYLFNKSLVRLGLLAHPLTLVDDETSQELFEKSVEKLKYCSKKLKLKIVETLAICVESDEKVNSIEIELVFSIAITLEVPLPRLT